jgi:membrane carboxypeptidase/penicillin-binding protein
LGQAVEPRFVLRVTDQVGRTVWGQGTRVLPPAMDSAVAYVAVQMMRDAVDNGTGSAVRRYVGDDVEVAGKTGTTDDNTDVWFVGMTPNLVAGVWLGFDRPRTITPGAGGGGLAAPIFGTMLARWGGATPTPWVMPSTVVLVEMDRETGELAEPTTPIERRYVESFVAGTEPGALRVDGRRLFLTYGPLPYF